MPDITIPNTLSDGNTILASELNQNFTAVTDVVNGNIDNDNIAAGAAIAASKLAIASILTTASTVTVGVGTTGDANPRIALDSDGHLVMGSGSAAGDVRIKRESAGVAAIRNAADSAYEDLKVDNLTASGTVACDTVTPTNPVDETVGGTGQTSWTAGDIPYASASNTLSKLGAGSEGNILTISSGLPAWATGSGAISQATESTPIAGGTTTWAHGLGAVPKYFGALLRCAATDAGYAVNNYVTLEMEYDYSICGGGQIIYATSTNVVIKAMDTWGFYLPHKTNFTRTALTMAKWRIIPFARL